MCEDVLYMTATHLETRKPRSEICRVLDYTVLYNVYCIMYTIYCILYSVHYKRYTWQCTLRIVHYYTILSTYLHMHNVHCRMSYITQYSTVYRISYIVRGIYEELIIVCCTPYTLIHFFENIYVIYLIGVNKIHSF